MARTDEALASKTQSRLSGALPADRPEEDVVEWLTFACLLLLLVGCSGETSRRSGGAPPGKAACAAGERTMPDGSCQAAGLPVDMACPPGARERPAGGCQAAGVPEEACAAGRFVSNDRGGCTALLPEMRCPSGQMAAPGETLCHEVSPCGKGRWNAAIPEEPTTEYVDRTYTGSSSDGSRERPWKTLGEAVRAASPGAVVAVAAGRYSEDVLVTDKPLRIWGLCPAQTEVAGAGVQLGAITILGRASGTEVREVALTGPSSGVTVLGARSVTIEHVWAHGAEEVGVAVIDGAAASVRGVLIEDNTSFGLLARDSEVSVEATVIRATRLNGRGAFGYGIHVISDVPTGARTTLSLSASSIEENHRAGVLVIGAEANIEATVVRANGSGGAVGDPVGILLEPHLQTGAGAKLSLSASLIEANSHVGVFVRGSEADIDTTVVRATRPSVDGQPGAGIEVQQDQRTGAPGKLRLTASLIEENSFSGVHVDAAEADIEATVTRATHPDGAGRGGVGIAVQQSPRSGVAGKLSLRSSLVEQNPYLGVFVGASEANIEATVVRASGASGGASGRGISVEPSQMTGEGAMLRLTSSLIEHNQESGVYISGSEVNIDTTVVRATHPNRAGIGGRGINVQPNPRTGEAGRLALTGSLIEENHEVGVFVGASEAKIEATVVRATQLNILGEYGRGVAIQRDETTGQRAKLWLTTSLIEENHDVGVFCFGSEAWIEDVVVRATRQARLGAPIGDGILVMDGGDQSDVTIFATESRDNARVGVMIVGSNGELAGVRSTGNRFGLVLQPGTAGTYPVQGEGNVFEDNSERDVVTQGDLAVPDAAPPLP